MRPVFELLILDNRLNEEPYRLEYAKPGDAGLDLRACTAEAVTIKPGETKLISTGIAYQPDNGSVAGLILPRSSSGHKKGLVIGNLVGLIDSGYQGEVFVSAWNRNTSKFVVIQPMERIAQLVFVPVIHPEFKEVASFSAESERGGGGFGSTGSL